MRKPETSVVVTITGVILLFLGAIVITLFAPQFIDKSWTTPTSYYQAQMYEEADPNIYIATSRTGDPALQYVYHLHNGKTLLAFQESATFKIKAPAELEEFVTRQGEKPLKLTTRLLLLRQTDTLGTYNLYDPHQDDAFSLAETDGISEAWIDADYTLLDTNPHPKADGHLYVNNPLEYRVRQFRTGKLVGWEYNPEGQQIGSVEELKSSHLGFLSRMELIRLGEHIYAIEGCWYCHTDQSRTLIQDSVVNGSADYPAPPSAANEYIYQNVTFPGTRRIGPDLARVGIKRPNRDWHASHFWSPKTQSAGSIMPAFRHFFDYDPSGTPINPSGLPNYQFEALFQYLMTKGTRITAPTKAWWEGNDPVLQILNNEKQ